eukprot:gnl/TRDRNA2_/TRDRNA2_85080_c0_seq1.p1 gnl/TRDRNA2_/TRDRNA2_85080_c0~~gnl/TRDRNA2_/TRDRNA2_85080_c0_seq1.p1  ORF type:complete len:536 (+),score=65.24 gnl/TRDRNA2_/TRDRNA2_85080_c0_seq1:102-1709(+)
MAAHHCLATLMLVQLVSPMSAAYQAKTPVPVWLAAKGMTATGEPICEHVEGGSEMAMCTADSHESSGRDTEGGLFLLQTQMSLQRQTSSPEELTRVTLSGDGKDEESKKVAGFKIPGMKQRRSVTVRELSRPIWQKTLRCTGPTETSCEPCIESECWTWKTVEPPKRMRRRRAPTAKEEEKNLMQSLTLDAESKFQRFISAVHVQCASPRIGIVFVPKYLYGGKLRFFWDGVEITKENGFDMETNDNYDPSRSQSKRSKKRQTRKEKKTQRFRKWSWDVPHPGGHEFTMEFTKYKGQRARIDIQGLSFYMPSSYATCQDTKVCLSMLGSSPAAMELRNDNTFQMKCLKLGWRFLPEPKKSACMSWHKCLDKVDDGKHDKVTELLHILEAAHVGSQAAVTQEPSDKQCIFPPTADPESWDCDCHDEMLCRCREIQHNHKLDLQQEFVPACLNAQFCLHPGVCPGWKKASCGGKIQELQRVLQGLPKDKCTASSLSEIRHDNRENKSMALQERSRQRLNDSSSGKNLDEVTGAKSCK